MALQTVWRDLMELRQSPRLTIDLMLQKTIENDAFFGEVVRKFYATATARHPRMPLIPHMRYGVAVYVLPPTHKEYLLGIEASARRNIKKASRNGYIFRRIDFNDHLADVGEIHRSTSVRQGPMSSEFQDDPTPLADPKSRTNCHDYVYYGVLKEGKLFAYGSCLVAGEALLLTNVFGHDEFKSDAVVPLLITAIAADAYERYPQVRYYVYDKYYGAGQTLRRFKKKFGFASSIVHWRL